MSGGRIAVVRVMLMFTASSRAPARRKRPISKPSIPKAFTTRKPEIVSCRISEMSFQRRSDVSFDTRRRRLIRKSSTITIGMPTSDASASFQSMTNSTISRPRIVRPSFSRSPASSETAAWIFSTSVVTWLMSEPVVWRPRKANDWFRMCS
jgi:hypothetical protein